MWAMRVFYCCHIITGSLYKIINLPLVINLEPVPDHNIDQVLVNCVQQLQTHLSFQNYILLMLLFNDGPTVSRENI